MNTKNLICTIITAAISLSAMAKEQPKWLSDAFIYHIYPSSYMDSNGDGIGDLNGIRSKLDYIAETGFNCIWMSPCFLSAWEDGGYDILDYYTIDPRFGTNADMDALLREAHAKGIRVCLDLVAGHTSDKHPWFKESLKAERNKYSDYFIWTEGKEMGKPDASFVDNDYPRNGYFMKNFFEIQPALNYGFYQPNPDKPWEQAYEAEGPTAVRNELKSIIAFWCDKGVDGFRVDLAPSLVKNDVPERLGVRRLWNEIFAWYNEKYPENIMLSEWSEPEQSLAAGFNIDLLIHNKVGGKIYRPLVCETGNYLDYTVCYFNRAGKGELRDAMQIYDEVYKAARQAGGYASMPTCSHDIWRLRRMNRDTEIEHKVAMTWFLTLPAPPIVYYGEEIGMRNVEYAPAKEGSMWSRNRSTSRTPMQWDNSANAGFSTVKDATKLYLPVDNSFDMPNVAGQVNDPASILNYVKGLIELRKNTPALGADADWEYVGDLDNPYPMIYERRSGNERYLIVINPSGREVSGQVEAHGKKAEWVYGTNKKDCKYRVKDCKMIFTMKPTSTAIWKVL